MHSRLRVVDEHDIAQASRKVVPWDSMQGLGVAGYNAKPADGFFGVDIPAVPPV